MLVIVEVIGELFVIVDFIVDDKQEVLVVLVLLEKVFELQEIDIGVFGVILVIELQ